MQVFYTQIDASSRFVRYRIKKLFMDFSQTFCLGCIKHMSGHSLTYKVFSIRNPCFGRPFMPQNHDFSSKMMTMPPKRVRINAKCVKQLDLIKLRRLEGIFVRFFLIYSKNMKIANFEKSNLSIWHFWRVLLLAKI